MYSNSNIRIVIACEFAVFRNGLKLLLEREKTFSIIGEVTNLNDTFNILKETNPDIIIINLSITSESVNSLCINIHSKYPEIPILLFWEDSFELSVADLIINGVRGIIWKDNSDLDVIEAIKCVTTGGSFFEDPSNCKFNCHLSNKLCDKKEAEELTAILSKREIEVLKLISRGLMYKEIADSLNISSRTVEAHKNHILKKLNLNNKNELIRYAIENMVL